MFTPVKTDGDYSHWKPEKRIREIYNQYSGDHELVLQAVAKEFNWTIGQAYIATEFLYRPPNFN